MYAMGISYFLPLVPRPQKSRKRMRLSVLPLFSGYLFFKGGLEQRHNILRSNRVAQILEVPDQARLYTELKNIHSLLLEDKRVRLCDFVQRGQRVIITHGPFKGITGIVQTLKNKSFVIISIECIRQSVRVEIPLDQIKPLRISTSAE